MTSTSVSKTGFFSLPAELRNQIYEYISSEQSHVSGTVLPSETHHAQDFRLQTTSNFMSPRTPSIMLASKQLRHEYLVYDRTLLSLRLNTYDEFQRWYQTIGRSASRLVELHLQMNIQVKVWTRVEIVTGIREWRSKPRAAVLRVRYNDLSDEPPIEIGGAFAFRVWYDVWKVDGETLSITPMCAEQLRKHLRQYLSSSSKITLPMFLDLIEQFSQHQTAEFWDIGDSDECKLDDLITNTLCIRICDLERRQVASTQYPPSGDCMVNGSCCTCENWSFRRY